MPLSTSLTSRLSTQPESLPVLIRGLSEAELKQEVNPGKWSAFDNIVHLAAYQPTFIERLQRMGRENSPRFERYIADNDPLFHEYRKFSLPEVLDDFATQRFIINNHLAQLSEQSLRKEGTHPLYGQFNIAQWAEFFLLHEAHHFFTIFMLTASLRKAKVASI